VCIFDLELTLKAKIDGKEICALSGAVLLLLMLLLFLTKYNTKNERVQINRVV